MSTPDEAETDPARTDRILVVENLSIRFRRRDETVSAVDGISLDVARGETLCLVGESGSGKSATALALMRLLPPQAIERVSGRIVFDGRDLSGLPDQEMRRLCGDRIAMIFQEPMSSLNPLLTIGQQLDEAIDAHRRVGARKRRDRILELLNLVGIDRPRDRVDAYPHQLSGGQLQRVMIAMAIANEPDLLIADEPTTALDVTVQAQILSLLRRLKRQLGMTLLLITHDFRVVRAMADRVCVMRAGEVVEIGAVREVMERPRHPYTRELLDSEPEERASRPTDDTLLVSATDIAVRYPVYSRLMRRVRSHFTALEQADLSLREGETLGVVGESGSGKSTLGRALLRLVPTEGRIVFQGRDLVTLPTDELRRHRRAIQMVFQDPFGSLSPRMRIGPIVGEGLRVNGLARDRIAYDRAVAEALADVELEPALARRFPHELSGG
ncbi:MAG: ATP-binding cassette domain-containing protein [Azospirillaceae bacterium]